MPFRAPIALRRQAFSTSSRFRTSTLPSHFYTTSTQTVPLSSTAPKVGRIGRWYLPAMALIAASFAIANAIEEHYKSKMQEDAERHRRMLEAYGERTTMEDMQRAIEVYEVQ